jgi:hypothetical protein
MWGVEIVKDQPCPEETATLKEPGIAQMGGTGWSEHPGVSERRLSAGIWLQPKMLEETL